MDARGVPRLRCRSWKRRGFALVLVLGLVVLLASLSISFHDQMSARLLESRAAQWDAEAVALARGGIDMVRVLMKADSRDYLYLYRDGGGDQGSAQSEDGGAEGGSAGGGSVGSGKGTGSDASIKGRDQTPLDKIYQMLAKTVATGFPLEDGLLSVDLIDENAKYNVNRVTAAVLERLFLSIKLKRKKRLELLGETVEEDISREASLSVVNWRSPEGAKVAGGADDSWYQKQDPPYKSRSAPFDVVEELVLVKDLTPETVLGAPPVSADPDEAAEEGTGSRTEGDGEGNTEVTSKKKKKPGPPLVDLLTVYGNGKINVNNASRDVLRALPGIFESPAREAMASALIERRPFKSVGEAQSVISGADPKAAGIAAAGLQVTSQALRVRATGWRGPRRRVVEAVLLEGPGGIKTLYYRED